MKKRTHQLCLLIISAFTSVSFASSPLPITTSLQATNPSRPPLIVPGAPRLDAKAYVLMDANSGAIIAEKNMNQKLAPASLTKLMTLYVASQALAQEQIRLDDKVRVSKQAWSRGGSRMFLKEGSYVTIKALIEGIIVASGNDACVATAEYIGGNEKSFAQLMNQAANRIGMKASHFVDSTGLPKPGHFSTAHDLALLARALIQKFPQYYGWYKQKWIKYNGIRQPNRNRLLWRDPSVDGLKTGHTNAAGYCLIASATRQGMRLISVVLGTPSDQARSSESQALINWGYRYYQTYSLFKANTVITNARVWLSQHKNISLGLQQNLYVTIPSGEYKLLKANIQLQPKLRAPIIKGQSYGKIQVTLNGTTIADTNLVALQDDPKGGWISRLIDHIELFFKNLF
jgi:serine-type D-Ala-D-Ala carboxypeptidase (penicillin-binding protein 5/6)